MIQMRDHTELPKEASDGYPAMSCEEFQEQLSGLISSDIRNHEHLRSCLRCNALLDELEYITEIAKGLLPSYDPSDRVWDKITKSIHDTRDGQDHPNGSSPELKQ